MKRERGFTLIEFLVVLGIMSLALVMVIPELSSGSTKSVQAENTALELAAHLRATRAAAVAAGRPADFTLNVGDGTFAIDGQMRRIAEADAALRLTLYTDGGAVINRTTGAIRFYPDGGSTGGGIAVGAGTDAFVVAVDWLGGSVSVGRRDAHRGTE